MSEPAGLHSSLDQLADRPSTNSPPTAASYERPAGATRAAAAYLNVLATCETTLETLKAAGNPVDTGFVADLEKLVERTRRELTALAVTPSARQ
jgi:hypothetical protein